MNSKSIGLHLENSNNSGRIEVYEPDFDGDVTLLMYNSAGKLLGEQYMSAGHAREVAMLLLAAADYKV